MKTLGNAVWHAYAVFTSKKLILLFVFFLAFFQNKSYAQEKPVSAYADLSRFAFAKQKDSLKKAWVCPAVYKDKKTQAKYVEIWDSRTSFLIDAIQGNNFIYNKEIIAYVNGIISELTAANKDLIKGNPLLLIDRSESVNAYAIGGNVLAVNLGLISYVTTREELALILAHELAHNILDHTGNAMKQKAELLTSEEYKASLNDVLSSEYGRLTKLKEVLKSYSFSRSKHSRYKESEADSLAIVMLNKTKLNFNAEYFLKLDSSDNEYRTELKQPAKSYFTAFNLNLEDQWFVKKSKGLSGRNYNFSKGENLTDSLKTHPDCIERYNATKHFTSANTVYTTIPASIHEAADKMIVWNLYNNMSLTPALYRIMLLKDKNNKDAWYDIMVYNIFAGLYYSDRKLARFNSIGVVPKELISKDYYATQTMLEQIPAEQLSSAVKSMGGLPFWSGASSDSRGFKSFLTSLISREDISKKEQESSSKEFLANYPTSIYAEVADKFK